MQQLFLCGGIWLDDEDGLCAGVCGGVRMRGCAGRAEDCIQIVILTLMHSDGWECCIQGAINKC